MTTRGTLLYMLKVNREALKELLDDITDEESLVRLPNGGNHIRWLTGHLVCYNSNAAKLLGDKNDRFDKLSQQFGAGSEIPADSSMYPQMEELRKLLYRTYDDAIKLLESVDDSYLETEVGEEDRKRRLSEVIAFYRLHDFYHAGQITALRRALGRQRPFA
jgi:hypothetical protein